MRKYFRILKEAYSQENETRQLLSGIFLFFGILDFIALIFLGIAILVGVAQAIPMFIVSLILLFTIIYPLYNHYGGIESRISIVSFLRVNQI